MWTSRPPASPTVRLRASQVKSTVYKNTRVQVNVCARALRPCVLCVPCVSRLPPVSLYRLGVITFTHTRLHERRCTVWSCFQFTHVWSCFQFTHTSSRYSPVRMRSFRNSASLERPKGAYPRLISNFGSTIAHKIPLCELLDEPLTSKLCHAPTPPSLLPADLEPWGGQKRWSGSPATVDEVTAYLRSRDPVDDSAMTEEYRQRPSMWLSSPMHVDLAEGHYLSPRLRKHRSRAAASALPSDDNAAWLQFYGAAVARARAGGPSPRQASQTGSAVAVEDVVEDNVRSGRLALSQLQAAAGANRAFFLQKQVRRPVFDHVRAVRACSAHARLMPGLALLSLEKLET
jgi:hypothetical protein